MRRFMMELEARLAALGPRERDELAGAYRDLIRGVSASTRAIGVHFRPSKIAALGLLTDLGTALGNGAALVAKVKQLAPTIGPHVAALVQAL